MSGANQPANTRVRNLTVAEVQIIRNLVATGVYVDSFPYIQGSIPGATSIDDAFFITPPGDGRVWSLLKLDGGSAGLSSFAVQDLVIDSTTLIRPSFAPGLPTNSTVAPIIVGGQNSTVQGQDFQNILQAAAPIPIRDKMFLHFSATSPAGPGFTFDFGIFILETFSPRDQQFPFRR